MSYTFLFYQHIMFRKSCGKCHFTNTRRPSDITIADFWGWEKTDKEINKDDKGVSLLLVNTEKGRKLLELIKEDMILVPANLEDCLQPNLQHPSIIHKHRDQFERDYKEKGFEYVYKKWGKQGWRQRCRPIINRVKRILKRLGIKRRR